MAKQKTPSLVTIAILTLITVLFWIGFNIYRSLTVEPPEKVPAEILEPISPTLDVEALGKLSARVYFEEYQLPETIVSAATPSSSLTTEEEAPEATESAATEEETEEATESGETAE